MKSLAVAIILCGILLGAIEPKVRSSPDLQPTPLEAFAQLPTTKVVWSREVGRLESTDAHAVLTAIVLEDPAQPPDRMRGLRIGLRNQKSDDQIYLGEETLPAYRDALDEISRFQRSPQPNTPPGGTQYFGARLFWYGNNTPYVHALDVADYVAPRSSGLSLSAFRQEEFRFPGQEAAQLSQEISEAITQLKGK